MDITILQEQGRFPVTVLRIKGNVDSSSAWQLEARAKAAIAAGAQNLVLDLSGVPYISSAGLRVVNILFNRLIKEAQGESKAEMMRGVASGTFKSPHLKLVNPQRRVLEVLCLGGFDMFLEIHRNLKEAVASF